MGCSAPGPCILDRFKEFGFLVLGFCFRGQADMAMIFLGSIALGFARAYREGLDLLTYRP